jgi:hypothetical protein
VGEAGLTLGRASQRIFGGQGFPLSEPCTSWNAVEGVPSAYARGPDRCICVGGASTRSLFRRFSGRGFLRGLLLLIAGFGYP